ELYLTHAQMRTLYGRTNMNPLSRFISEIPSELLQGMSEEKEQSFGSISPTIQKTERQTPRRRARKLNTPHTTGADGQTWQPRDKAHHKAWGVGTVVKVQNSGDALELDIAFPAPTGIKRLLAKYAPISK